MKDHTIELWTWRNAHYAHCTCSWNAASHDKDVLESLVQKHRNWHHDNGDTVEII